MGSFLSVEENESIYSSQVSLEHVRDWTPVPRCSPMTDSLSMWSGTFYGQGSLCERLWPPLHILLLIQSESAEGRRSWGHACLFV